MGFATALLPVVLIDVLTTGLVAGLAFTCVLVISGLIELAYALMGMGVVLDAIGMIASVGQRAALIAALAPRKARAEMLPRVGGWYSR